MEKPLGKLRSCQIMLPAERAGVLRRSDDILGDIEACRSRMESEGYLWLPGFYDRDDVRAARSGLIRLLAEFGSLDAESDPDAAVLSAGATLPSLAELQESGSEIESLICSDRVKGWFDAFLGGPSKHYDYTWIRAVRPGGYTLPHLDIVYMGRGTRRLSTLWTPLGDIPYELGGLAILENSHFVEELRSGYGAMDVDSYCANKPETSVMEDRGFTRSGAISGDPLALAEQYGLRWLTAEFKMGDAVIFGTYTLHGSTDNQTNRIRLSVDTRFQLASEPADQRWNGAGRKGHGPNARESLIC